MDQVADFLMFLDLEQRSSRNTLSAYQSDLAYWFSVLPIFAEPERLSKAALLECLGHLESETFKDSTKHRKRAVLRSYLRYHSQKNKNLIPLLDLIALSSFDNKLPRALSVDDVRALLDCVETASTMDPRALRDSAFLNLLYSSGLRVSEALNLTWSDIDEQREVLRVEGKGSKERLVPYSDRAAKALRKYEELIWPEWQKRFPHSNRIFISPRAPSLSRMAAWKILDQWSAKAGIGHVHPHVLRHSLASHLLAGGADVRFVQVLLGHSSLNTTSRYLKLDDPELKRLFTEFHPLNTLLAPC